MKAAITISLHAASACAVIVSSQLGGFLSHPRIDTATLIDEGVEQQVSLKPSSVVGADAQQRRSSREPVQAEVNKGNDAGVAGQNGPAASAKEPVLPGDTTTFSRQEVKGPARRPLAEDPPGGCLPWVEEVLLRLGNRIQSIPPFWRQPGFVQDEDGADRASPEDVIRDSMQRAIGSHQSFFHSAPARLFWPEQRGKMDAVKSETEREEEEMRESWPQGVEISTFRRPKKAASENNDNKGGTTSTKQLPSFWRRRTYSSTEAGSSFASWTPWPSGRSVLTTGESRGGLELPTRGPPQKKQRSMSAQFTHGCSTTTSNGCGSRNPNHPATSQQAAKYHPAQQETALVLPWSRLPKSRKRASSGRESCDMNPPPDDLDFMYREPECVCQRIRKSASENECCWRFFLEAKARRVLCRPDAKNLERQTTSALTTRCSTAKTGDHATTSTGGDHLQDDCAAVCDTSSEPDGDDDEGDEGSSSSDELQDPDDIHSSLQLQERRTRIIGSMDRQVALEKWYKSQLKDAGDKIAANIERINAAERERRRAAASSKRNDGICGKPPPLPVIPSAKTRGITGPQGAAPELCKRDQHDPMLNSSGGCTTNSEGRRAVEQLRDCSRGKTKSPPVGPDICEKLMSREATEEELYPDMDKAAQFLLRRSQVEFKMTDNSNCLSVKEKLCW
ncbi:unnamed protein product [Amoebophrya sp. A120]|nr:unnamed protein product [Amoebophrya sp. A120]|eukprot:GSA120T00012798001.1